jgi:hypothetical protein
MIFKEISIGNLLSLHSQICFLMVRTTKLILPRQEVLWLRAKPFDELRAVV